MYCLAVLNSKIESEWEENWGSVSKERSEWDDDKNVWK